MVYIDFSTVAVFLRYLLFTENNDKNIRLFDA